MFDPTKPVQTSNPNIVDVEILATDITGDCPILVKFTYSNGVKSFSSHYRDGRCYKNDSSISDLINIPEKHVRYLNFDEHGRLVIDNGCYEDKKSADFQAGSHRTACIRVEFESGQFDE